MEKHIFQRADGHQLHLTRRLLLTRSHDDEKGAGIGVYGQRHLRYIKHHRTALYLNLLTTGKLNGYLADIDKQAEEMLVQLAKQMAECEGVTEQLKATDQMEWVIRMNNIQRRAAEFVNRNIIYN